MAVIQWKRKDVIFVIKAIMIGAGARGIGVYGEYAKNHPEDLSFVGVADPDKERRMYFAMQHGIPEERQYTDYRDILEKERFADVCFICTQDDMHLDPAIKALNKDYHIFLEKPIATTPSDVLAIKALADKHDRLMMIAHVLRYTDFFSKIKSLIDDGSIGDLISIQHNENVGYWHAAHSYVRGKWHRRDEASPMILAKSCHDLDLLLWFADEPVKSVSSFGSLSYFKRENQPEGAPDYCTEGCPHEKTCPYFAPRVYKEGPIWFKFAVSNQMTEEAIMEALKKGPYGRCVYACDNDVVDHQVTNIEFEDGVTVAFTMSAFTTENTRTIKVMGSEGEIRGHLLKNELEIRRFGEEEHKTIRFEKSELSYDHGGGDQGIMDAFVRTFKQKEAVIEKDLDYSFTSHLLAFAADESRLNNKTVDFQQFVKRIGK